MATKKTQTSTPKKMGRPPVAEVKKTFAMRLTESERKALKFKADSLGIPETTYVRMTLRQALGLTGPS